MITINYTYQADPCYLLTTSERILGLRDKYQALVAFESLPEVQSSLFGRNVNFNLLSGTTSQKFQNAFFPHYDGIDLEYEQLLANLLIGLDGLCPIILSTDWKDYCLQTYTTAFRRNEKIMEELSGDYHPNLSALLLLIRIGKFLESTPDRHYLPLSFLKSFNDPLSLPFSTFDPLYIRDTISMCLQRVVIEADAFSKVFMKSQVLSQRRHLEYGNTLKAYDALETKHQELFQKDFFKDRLISFNLTTFSCIESTFFNQDDFEYQKKLSIFFSNLAKLIDTSLHPYLQSDLSQCKIALFTRFYDVSLFYQKVFEIQNETALFFTVATRILQHTCDMLYPLNQSFMEYIKEGVIKSDDAEFQNGITLLCQFYISNVQAFLVS